MNAATVSRTFLSIALMQILAASLSLAQVPKKGGAQLDCQKLLSAAEVGRILGRPDVKFDARGSQNGVVGSSVAICSYTSGGLPVAVLQIEPTGALGDPYRFGKVGTFKDVQPKEVPGLGAPAKLWVTKDRAVLVVVAGSSTLQVGVGWLGATGPQEADAEVAIAKLVLPRIPGH